MIKHLRNALIVLVIAPLELAEGRGARAQGFLEPLFNSEIQQHYAAGSSSEPIVLDRKPRARATGKEPNSPTPKTVTRAKQSKLTHAPLPPARPWGDRDAPAGLNPEVADAPPKDPLYPPTGSSKLERSGEKITAFAHGSPTIADESQPGRSILLITRRDLGVDNMSGRRIATGLFGETAEHLREIVLQGAGLQVSPIELSWSAGLDGLARGEVDGVTLSVGPRLRAEDTKGLAMDPFHVLEIPLNPSFSAVRQ